MITAEKESYGRYQARERHAQHRTVDPIYTASNAEKEIKIFTNVPNTKVKIVEGLQ